MNTKYVWPATAQRSAAPVAASSSATQLRSQMRACVLHGSTGGGRVKARQNTTRRRLVTAFDHSEFDGSGCCCLLLKVHCALTHSARHDSSTRPAPRLVSLPFHPTPLRCHCHSSSTENSSVLARQRGHSACAAPQPSPHELASLHTAPPASSLRASAPLHCTALLGTALHSARAAVR